MAARKTQSEKSGKRGLGFLALLLILVLNGFDVFAVPSIAPSDWGLSGGDVPSGVDDGDKPGDGQDASNDDGGSDKSGTSDSSDKNNTGASTTITPNEERPLDDPFFYARSTLSKSDQEAYDLMYEAFVNRTEMTYSFESPDAIARIRDCVEADHPEIFYVKSVSYSSSSSSTHTVRANYLMSEEEAADCRDPIDLAVGECLNSMPSGLDDYGKVKYVYEYVVNNTQYGGAVEEGQNIDSVFVDGVSVCSGYAKAFQYLVQQVGVSCLYVTGETSEPHAWCMVKVGGEWYVVDPTWGDPSYESESSHDNLSYAYLCVTEKDASYTHTLRCTYDVPTCDATADNYFVREGMMLDTADVDRAGSIIVKAEAEGKPSASFRCSSKEVFNEMVEELIKGRRIYDYMDAGEYTYSTDDNLCIVQIFF